MTAPTWDRRDAELAPDYLPDDMAAAVRGLLADYDRIRAALAHIAATASATADEFDAVNAERVPGDVPGRVLRVAAQMAATALVGGTVTEAES